MQRSQTGASLDLDIMPSATNQSPVRPALYHALAALLIPMIPHRLVYSKFKSRVLPVGRKLDFYRNNLPLMTLYIYAANSKTFRRLESCTILSVAFAISPSFGMNATPTPAR
jgi:hypothetical protein